MKWRMIAFFFFVFHHSTKNAITCYMKESPEDVRVEKERRVHNDITEDGTHI
jgi:hypothetical protein